MKSYNHLYEKTISETNRRYALSQAKHSKRFRKIMKHRHMSDDAAVEQSLDWIVNYENAEHVPVYIYDGITRKERTIIVPTMEELLVQHCIVNAMKPMFCKGMYEHSYASLPGRGAHKGKQVIEKWIRTDPKNCKYVLKMDIRHFFDSIPHDRLKAKLKKTIHDEKMLELLFRIIDVTEVGIPLGFYTSQWLSNWYLQGLDHFIKEQLCAVHYMRYMDDTMPRRGENIYKRKDGRWEGRYIRGRTPAGKAEYGYVYAKSYAACREKRRRMEDALPQKPMLTGEMSVCQAAEFFLSERRGALKASTIGRYEYMIRHYIVPEIGTILLRDLTAEKLSVFFSRLQDRGLSCKSTRDVGVLLKTIFKVVKKKCHCDCPGRDVELPAYRSKKVEVFADHEIAALAQKVLDAPDITGLCVLLILNTGLRLGEICALRKSDIDFRSGFLRIERSAARVRDGSGTRLVVQAPKSNSSVRLVAIPNDMLELLKATTQSIQRGNYLLTNTDTPMEPRTLQYRYRKLLERCGIRYRNFHALRHTYATRCMESGVDIKSLSELLGHADIRTTLQTYVHSSLAHKKQAVQSICFLPIESTWGSLTPSKIPSEMPQSDALQRRADAGVVNCI